MLSTNEAAARIGKSPSWVNKSRMTGTGPVYLKIGAGVKYRPEDLDAWLEARRRTAVYAHANDESGARAAA